MKHYILSILCLASFTLARAQVKFDAFGEKMVTSKRVIYVDDRRQSNEKSRVFRTVNEALRYAEKVSSQKEWTTIYIAPSVYWVDSPDDPAVRTPLAGWNEPYGMMVSLNHVRLIGLSRFAEDVVLACNRGQTQGAIGNFTMLRIEGSDIETKNITFGNYCNVDLVYSHDRRKDRWRRADAIVQAQLIICKGDRYKARNCRFISRLNLCPFVGASRVDFDDCYFECTDDALCGTGVYNHCRFTFFSSKPFYCTSPQGAVFNNCDIHSKVKGTQYLTKVSDPVTMINCRWTSDDKALKIEWAKNPNPKKLCIMRGCTLNGDSLYVPPTPDVPMAVGFALFGLQEQRTIADGRWTLDAYKPLDTRDYDWQADTLRASWAFGEGVDGAEGEYGLIENVRGARLMYTGLAEETYHGQELTVGLSPCKGPGQGFGSATGQYMDLCLKFDTRTLTGYGLRFERTPRHDRAVEVCLVEYRSGVVNKLTQPEKCTLFRKGCLVKLRADGSQLVARILNGEEEQKLESSVVENTHGGIHIQHTGSTGASATVIKALSCLYF